MRVLIADDGGPPRDFAKRILSRAGHEIVACVENGALTVNAARLSDIDLAILDISMPVMTGVQAARIIIAEDLIPHVVIASSNSQDALVDQMRALGCGFVAKPYVKEQLLRELAAIVPGFGDGTS